MFRTAFLPLRFADFVTIRIKKTTRPAEINTRRPYTTKVFTPFQAREATLFPA